MKRITLSLLTLLSLASMAWADIECKETYDGVTDPIVVKVGITGVPEGAKLRGSFSISGKASYLVAGENQFHCWAEPGDHQLIAQGVWVLTQELDVNGTKVPVLVDFGQYHFEKKITVAGEVPPPVPPPPPGQRWAMILDETSQSQPAVRALYSQLRKEFQDSRLLIFDKDQVPSRYGPIAQQALATSPTLPVLAVVSESGKLLRTVPLPATVDGVKQEIAK